MLKNMLQLVNRIAAPWRTLPQACENIGGFLAPSAAALAGAAAIG